MSVSSLLRSWLAAALAALALTGCGTGAADPAARLLAASDGSDWASYGGNYSQRHYSPLTEIDQDNASSLGLAWSMDLPQVNSVTEPIAVDGVLYFAAGLSVVHAVDAVTGKELWQHDPRVGEVGGLNMRVGWGVRGVAWWNGKIYVGTQDGRLLALDAETGKLVWSAQTFRPDQPAYISGAPRAFGGLILIGSGSTTGAMRGYVAAYDAESGKEAWRFHTVPGNPADGFENEAMEMAAKTWSGEWWKFGGGGMVWNSMAYDPEAGLVYIGVGSPYPWDHTQRSEGKGDNLFATSIVALDLKTGKYRWHYQTVPGDTWDFDATMDIELAELEIDGRQRKVLMQAPKNGFLYVIDRLTGELLSAKPFVETTWASAVDMTTGRPIENPQARYDVTGKPAVVKPTALAAHNWIPMSFSPKSGLLYVPAVEWEAQYSAIGKPFVPPSDRAPEGGLNFMGGPLAGMPAPTGSLLALDPLTGKPVWRIDYPTYYNGGVLSTRGGLVFQGTIDGTLKAYAADTGKLVWSYDVKAPLIAPPITYRAGGKQYVTVLTGLGMGYSMNGGALIGAAIEKYGIDPLTQARRVLTFAIGGKQQLPPRREPAPPPPDPDFKPDPAEVMAGMAAYELVCSTCHGSAVIGIGNGPDLRRSAVPLDKGAFEQVVRGGALAARGMPGYSEYDDAKLEAIRQYLRSRAADLRGNGQAPQPAPVPLQIR
jgi:quinohemoprotein ethanol dehydrogenase